MQFFLYKELNIYIMVQKNEQTHWEFYHVSQGWKGQHDGKLPKSVGSVHLYDGEKNAVILKMSCGGSG